MRLDSSKEFFRASTTVFDSDVEIFGFGFACVNEEAQSSSRVTHQEALPDPDLSTFQDDEDAKVRYVNVSLPILCRTHHGRILFLPIRQVDRLPH